MAQKYSAKQIIIGLIIAVSFSLMLLLVSQDSQKKAQIVQAKDNSFTTKNASFEAKFASVEDPQKISFKKEESEISFKIPEKNVKWEKQGEKLVADVGEAKAFSYSLIENKEGGASGLKEEIILKKPPTIESKKDPQVEVQNRFEFALDLKGLTYKKGADGLWHFYNQEGKDLFYIPKPFMEDEKGERSEKVKIDITQNKLIITVDKEWLMSSDRVYPIYIDPSFQLTILTVHSHPQAGDNWIVDFETEGKADLKIIPDDQATIDDMDFVELKCGEQKRNPDILQNDIIYFKDWECNKTASVNHLVNTAAPHRLKFEFAGQKAYAYNAPGSSTYTFSGVTQATNDYYAYEDYGATIFSGPDDTGEGEATDTDYSNITSDDGSYWVTEGAGGSVSTDTGWVSPGTIVSDSEVGESSWSNPSYADSEDGSVAQARVYSGINCFSEDTLISTKTGEKLIKNLESDDLVYSFNFNKQRTELKSVISIGKKPVFLGDKYYHIYYTDGELRATYNQKFFVENKIKRAKDLEVGDNLIDIDGNKQTINKILIEDNADSYVWDIEVKENHNFFANDVLVHNADSDIQDNRVRIVKGGSIGTTDKADTITNWPSSLTYTNYGGSTDLWGETWSASDINASNFGVVISATGTTWDSEYLKATNFGFSVPTGATIDGIEVSIKKRTNYHSPYSDAEIDHIQIKVYYTGDPYDSQLYKFYIDESESVVSQLDFKWTGYGETESGYNTTLYAYNYSTTTWDQLAQVDFTATTDQDLTHTETTNPGNYIDTDGEVTLMAKTAKYDPPPPPFCSTSADYDSSSTVDGDTVYCDADGDMWTETASSTYEWGGYEVDNPDDSCVGDGSDYEACHYCDTLTYAGYSDWQLPTCTNDDNLPSSCQLYQFGVDNCDWNGGDGGQSSCTPAWDTNAASSTYWSSTESNSYDAWRVYFDNGYVVTTNKPSYTYVRCVR